MITIPPFIQDGKFYFSHPNSIQQSSFSKLLFPCKTNSPITESGAVSVDTLLSVRNLLSTMGAGCPFQPSFTGSLIAGIQILCGVNLSNSYFVDIGSYDGSVADGYMQLMKQANVFKQISALCLIEIIESMCDQMENKYKHQVDPVVHVVNKAIHHKSGYMQRYLKDENSDNEIYSLLSTREIGCFDQTSTNTVECCRLDDLHNDLLSKYGFPRAVRIQVNGREYDVIRSFGELIEHVDIISFTMAAFGFEYLGYNLIHDYLSSNQFVVLRMTPHGFYVLPSPEYIDNKIPFITNYIAIKTELFQSHIIPRAIDFFI